MSIVRSSVKPDPKIIDQTLNYTSTITIQLRDADENVVEVNSDQIRLETSSGKLSPLISKGNGHYLTTLTAKENVTIVTVSVIVAGEALLDKARVAVKVKKETPLSQLAQLGEAIFKDRSLSNPAGMSCNTCHDIDSGSFSDIRANNQTSMGAKGLAGGRNAISLSYAAHTPIRDIRGPNVFGGFFYDNRAATLEEQAQGPLLSSLEMNNSSKSMVIDKVRTANYAPLFKQVFGESSLDGSSVDKSDQAFSQLSQAIAAFERSRVLSPFTSKWDAVQAETEFFSVTEKAGFKVFLDQKCDTCHVTIERFQGADMFTNFLGAKIDTPINPSHPFLTNKNHPNYDPNFRDLGLGTSPMNAADAPHTGNRGGKGDFRMITLRNVAKTAPYMHNGVFETLEEVINFYNVEEIFKRSTPEYPREEPLEREVKMTAADKRNLKAFMEALSDR